jgi:hypothetical protein
VTHLDISRLTRVGHVPSPPGNRDWESGRGFEIRRRLFVGELTEALVELADPHTSSRRFETDHLVGECLELTNGAGGPTGIAKTTRLAAVVWSSWRHALTVDPVATPSSTTVFPIRSGSDRSRR